MTATSTQAAKTSTRKPGVRGPAKKKSMIKYADKRLIPGTLEICAHPALSNNPDAVTLIPNQRITVETGLQIALPPNQFIMAVQSIPGTIITKSVFAGFQKNLKIELWNITNMNLTINPYIKVADLFISEAVEWK